MANRSTLRAVDASDEWPLQLFVTYRLSTLSAKLNRQAGAVLKQAGKLRVPEWRILALLAVHGEMTASEITDIAALDPGLISRAFRALELRDLIIVRRSDADRRSVYVSLTKTGSALHAKVLPIMQKRQRHLMGALTVQERTMFLRIIDRLQIAAEARTFPATKA